MKILPFHKETVPPDALRRRPPDMLPVKQRGKCVSAIHPTRPPAKIQEIRKMKPEKKREATIENKEKFGPLSVSSTLPPDQAGQVATVLRFSHLRHPGSSAPDLRDENIGISQRNGGARRAGGCAAPDPPY